MRIGAPALNDVAGAWPSVPQAVDGRAKAMAIWRKLLPFAIALARLAWTWRWLTLTTAIPFAVVPALLGFGRIGALVTLLLMGLVAWRWGFLRTRLARARRETPAVLMGLWWPFCCSLCGFVEVAGRRVRTARLVEFTAGPRLRWMRFVVQPCLNQDPTTWGRYETRLRSHFRYRASTWTIPDDNPNVIEVTVLREPLPTEWILGTDVTLDDTAPASADQSTTHIEGSVYLGAGADGTDMVWCPDEDGRSNLFVSGRTGGGKGETARLILGYGIRAGWHITVLNPKRIGEFRWLGASAQVAKYPADMFTLVAQFRTELERRCDLLDEVFGVAKWTDVPLVDLADYDMATRQVLLIDELVSLLTMRGQVFEPAPEGKGRPRDLLVDLNADLQVISSMGRAAGMSLVVMTQHPIGETMGPFGSTVKSNLGARIGCGALEPEGAGALFGKAHGEAIATLLRAGTPGRCVYQGLAHDDGGSWKVGQALYDRDRLLTSFAEPGPELHAVDTVADDEEAA